MEILVAIVVNALAVMIVSYLLSSMVKVESFTSALVVAVLLAVANAVIKPILAFFTLPLTILTFGLFIFVINALMVLLVSKVYKGFQVKDFIAALLFSLLLGITNSVLFWFFS